MNKRQRTCDESQFQLHRLYIGEKSNKKDVLLAFYHLHKNDTDILEKAKMIDKEYTWVIVKQLTDEKYNNIFVQFK